SQLGLDPERTQVGVVALGDVRLHTWTRHGCLPLPTRAVDVRWASQRLREPDTFGEHGDRGRGARRSSPLSRASAEHRSGPNRNQGRFAWTTTDFARRWPRIDAIRGSVASPKPDAADR